MTNSVELAIRTEDLRKTYKSSRGDVPAVRGIDLSVRSGQFFGLLGPNGAGKSTTIGMLTTLILPTGGQAWVAGMDVVADPVGVKRRIGVVTQNNTLDMQLTVAENLEFRSRFFGLGLREASRRAEQMLEVFGLADRRKAMSTDLSGGQAKRLLIARALVHRPDVLFLDEPTAGLDPQTRANLWDILRVLHAEGQTILLTTHYMEEAEALCEQIAVIDHGEVLASGTVNDLKDGAGAETVITVRYDEPVPDGMAEQAGLGRRLGVSKVEADGDQVRVFTREPDGVLGVLVTAGSAAGRAGADPDLIAVGLHLADAGPATQAGLLGHAVGDRLVVPDRDDRLGARARLELIHGPRGEYLAVVDDRDLLAQRLGFLHVVRGQQDRLPLGVQHPQDVPEVSPGLRVEPGGRLVQEQHVRPVHQGPRDQQPLGLPAGQVGGHRLAPVREPEHLEQLVGAARGLAQPEAEEPAAELQVLRHGQLHVERVVLGHHADPALHRNWV